MDAGPLTAPGDVAFAGGGAGAAGALSGDRLTGVVLAVSSSVFIGSSFIVKKKGLRRAGASGIRAGSGGYSYLREPLWWAGLGAMVVGEAANFAAYAYAPAAVVTPLGALSVLVSAVLAHAMLHERLNVFGVVGCVLCVAGSLGIVLHAPEEAPLESVAQVWALATRPAFLAYAAAAVGLSLYLVWGLPPEAASQSLLVPVAVCSAVGSLSVVSCKALGVAIKLSLRGSWQLGRPEFYAFLAVVVAAVVTQMNYLNRALDLFNTALVAPIYYVMFTTLTVAASAVMYPAAQAPRDAAAAAAGFVTVVCGTFLLHATRDMDAPPAGLLGALGKGGSPRGSPRGGGGAGAGGGETELRQVAVITQQDLRRKGGGRGGEQEGLLAGRPGSGKY